MIRENIQHQKTRGKLYAKIKMAKQEICGAIINSQNNMINLAAISTAR